MTHVAIYYGPDGIIRSHMFESRAKSIRRLARRAKACISIDSLFTLEGPMLMEHEITLISIDKTFV